MATDYYCGIVLYSVEHNKSKQSKVINKYLLIIKQKVYDFGLQ